MNNRGFTIVEILLVIVVIGILATVSVVAYRGAQNKANDTAVQADLKNFGKRIEAFKIETGAYPSSADFTATLGIKFSKGAYGVDSQGYNARYCRNTTNDTYVMVSNSKSGNYFMVQTGAVVSSTASTDGYGVCSLVGVASTNPNPNGYSVGGWAAWVK